MPRLFRCQSIDQRTSWSFASITTAHGIRKHALHSAEIGNFCPNIYKMTRCKLADFDAGFMPAVGGQR